MLFLMPVAYGNVFTPGEESDIVEFVKNVMDCRNIPGLTLSVVKGDGTWTHGFGFADIKTSRKVTNETLFIIGSLGKAMTMALLGNVIQETGYVLDLNINAVRFFVLDYSLLI